MAQEKKFPFDILLYIFIPIVIFIIKDIPFVFYNNDDLFLKQIASGELTGTPEAHLLHIGYLTGILLSTLYKLFPAIPWYGILLFSYGYLSIILSLYMISKHIEKKVHRIIGSTLIVFVTLSFTAIHLINIQYTTITAIVCAASIVFFYLAEETEDVKKFLINNIPCFIFFFLALELRNKACIMFLPTFFLLILIKWFKNRKLTKPLLAYGSILLCLLALSFGIEKLAYSPSQWNTFKEYNTSRENVIDYNGYPDYYEFIEEYEALGITYQSYVSAGTRYQILLDENINADFMQKMEDLSSGSDFNIKEMCLTFWDRHTASYMDRPLNLIVYMLYFFTIVFILMSKNKKFLWDVLALFCGRNVIWFYLLFIGRPMPRVTQGIYIVELLVLLAIILSNRLWYNFFKKKKVLQYIIVSAFIACLLFTTIKWGLPNMRIIVDSSKNYLTHSTAYEEIRNYFYENEDNLYLLDTNSFSYFTEDIFAKTPASCNNFVLLGSWPANSPWTDSVLHQYGYASYERAAIEQDNVFFVFISGEQTNYDYLSDYYNEKYPGSSFIVTDTFLCTNGLEFIILQVQFE